MQQGKAILSARRAPTFNPLAHLHQIPKLLRMAYRMPLDLLRWLHAEYGDIVRLPTQPFYDPVYFIADPAAIQHVLIDNHQNYVKGHLYNLFELGFANGLVFSEGDLWQRQRRLLQPTFNHAHLEAYVEDVLAFGTARFPIWDTAAHTHQVLDLETELLTVVRAGILRILFGQNLPPGLDDHTEQARKAFMQAAAPSQVIPVRWLPAGRRLLYHYGQLEEQVWALIHAAKADDPATRDDLLPLLMHATDARTGYKMSDQQLHDELTTLIFTGYETTAQSVTWAVYLLSQHPAAKAALQAELDTVLAGRDPTLADLPRLPTTRAVLMESLRLYPPAWSNGRQALEPDELNGIPIPAGARVGYSQYVVHRHPAHWPNPNDFLPERWSPAASANRHPFAFFVFGAGKRQCIGRDLALMEGTLLLALFMQRYRLTPLPGWQLRYNPAVTLRPAAGLPVYIHHR